MSQKTPNDLTALVGSRICHDLISPLGAIGNGLELLQMTGLAASPELSLIAESVENANARVRFFRIAFGNAEPGQMVKSGELRAVLKAMYHGGRTSVHWDVVDMSRPDAKMSLLTLQCLETALPYGGAVRVTHMDGAFLMEASSDRIVLEEALWSRITDTGPQPELRPSQVQFGLLADLIRRERRRFNIELAADRIKVSF